MLKKTASDIFSKPATENYPKVKPVLPPDYRGQPLLDTELCIGCSLCSKNCPAKAIVMVEVDGKKRPQFDLAVCIFCYQCVETCPKKAIKNSTNYELATTDKASLIIKPQSTKQR